MTSNKIFHHVLVQMSSEGTKLVVLIKFLQETRNYYFGVTSKN